LEEEYAHLLDYKIKALSLQHQSGVELQSPSTMTTRGIAYNNDDEGKQPATNTKKLDKLNSGLAKQRIDWVTNGSATLSAEGNDMLDVMQYTQMNKRLHIPLILHPVFWKCLL